MSDTNMMKRKAIGQMTASEFKTINGTVMRMIILLFKTRWFTFREIITALTVNKYDKEEIYEALDYFESQGYIEVRDIEGRQEVRLSDMDEDEIEMKLTGEGKKVAYSIKTDDGIDL
jgi:hypothetical protein